LLNLTEDRYPLAPFYEARVLRGKRKGKVKASQAKRRNAMEWTAEAEARLKEIPFFVRPAARKKIEKLAQDVGATQITVEVYEQAKKKFGS
jgi:hypothetical protein